jgi:hypothetical protein
MLAVQCSAIFFFLLSPLGPKKNFPKKLGGAKTPFVPITWHVIMGNKDSIECYIIGMLHLIWPV